VLVTAAQEPSLPATSDDPKLQRLLAGTREIVQTLIRAGVFLSRSEVSSRTPILRPTVTGPTLSMRWGVLNRASLSADFTIQLPRIDSRWVGAPLDVVLMTTGNVLTLVPTGYALDGVTKPLINNAASVLFNTPGLYILKTDGLNWWMNAPG
jgi:hypothetical protein